MNVLITAGGTSEAIDSVRSITNYSTGRLGSIIADRFACENVSITYVCSTNAVLPSSSNVEIVRISDVQGLLQSIDGLLAKHKFDCVIHTMAVSDFTPKAVLTLDDIVANIALAVSGHNNLDAAQDLEPGEHRLAEKIHAAVLASAKPVSENKISSKESGLMIMLKQTPKIISRIKAAQPETILVGFKLLSGTTEDALLQAASNLLKQNSCDFVLANDLQNIKGDSHKAILINKNGSQKRANTKQEIAELIYQAITPRG